MEINFSQIAEKYLEDGFAIIPKFLTIEEVEELKIAATQLTKKCCEETPANSVFSGIGGQQLKDKYFAESGDKIRGFLEETALGPDGEILVPKEFAFNKIAHALHEFDPVFKKHTASDKVRNVIKLVTQFKKPIICQSMIIFKNPKVGGEVKPHQDGSYLYTEPLAESLIGFWIALDPANSQNGCLYFVPGSHKSGKLSERFVKDIGNETGGYFKYTGEKIGPIPKEKLVAAECQPGDLVLIDGLVVHQSEGNKSNFGRMAYTFHIYDGHAKWSELNWLQPTQSNTFVQI